MQPEAFHTRIHRSFSNKVAASDHKVVKLNLRSVPNQVAVEDQRCWGQTPKWSIIHRVRAAIDGPSKMAKFCFVVLIEFCLENSCVCVQKSKPHTRPWMDLGASKVLKFAYKWRFPGVFQDHSHTAQLTEAIPVWTAVLCRANASTGGVFCLSRSVVQIDFLVKCENFTHCVVLITFVRGNKCWWVTFAS